MANDGRHERLRSNTRAKADGKEITGIIGGTYIANNDGSDADLNKREYLGIIKRIKAFYGLADELNNIRENKTKF